ncbi:MAG: hypothetical protein DRQ98_11475 [Gammaproteobacteria bacterium]|nr:MAG: hypothetical protein DRQ98_11475 [Gammaproteobacteria bacterium]
MGWEIDSARGHPRAQPRYFAPMKLGLDREGWMTEGDTLRAPWVNAEEEGQEPSVHPMWAPRAEEVRTTVVPMQFRKLFPVSGSSRVPISTLIKSDTDYAGEYFAGASMLVTIQQLGLNIETAVKWLRVWHDQFPKDDSEGELTIYRRQWKLLLKVVESVRYWLQLAAGPHIIGRMHDEDGQNEVYWPPLMSFEEYVDLGLLLAAPLYPGDEASKLPPDPVEDAIQIEYEERKQLWEDQLDRQVFPFQDTAMEEGWKRPVRNTDRHWLAKARFYHPLVNGAPEGEEYDNIPNIWEKEEAAKLTRVACHQGGVALSKEDQVDLMPTYQMIPINPPGTKGFTSAALGPQAVNSGLHPYEKEKRDKAYRKSREAAMDTTPTATSAVGPASAAIPAVDPASILQAPETSARRPSQKARRRSSQEQRQKRQQDRERKQLERLQLRADQQGARLGEYPSPPIPPAFLLGMDMDGVPENGIRHPHLYMSKEAIQFLYAQRTVRKAAPTEVAEALGHIIPSDADQLTLVFLEIQTRVKAVMPLQQRTILKMATNLAYSFWDYTLQLFRRKGWTVLSPEFWDTWAREHETFGDFQDYEVGKKNVLEAFIIALFHFFLVPIRMRQEIIVLAWEKPHEDQHWTFAQEVLYTLMTYVQYGTLSSLVADFVPEDRQALERECLELDGETGSHTHQLTQVGEYKLKQRELGLAGAEPKSTSYKERSSLDDKAGTYRYEGAYASLAMPEKERYRVMLRNLEAIGRPDRKRPALGAVATPQPKRPKGLFPDLEDDQGGEPALPDQEPAEEDEPSAEITEKKAETYRRQMREYRKREADMIARAEGPFSTRPGALGSEYNIGQRQPSTSTEPSGNPSGVVPSTPGETNPNMETEDIDQQ